MLEEARQLRAPLRLDAGSLLAVRAQASGHGVDEEALQGVVLVERAYQAVPRRREGLQRAIEVGELPLLDAMELALDRQYPMQLFGVHGHRLIPSPASP